MKINHLKEDEDVGRPPNDMFLKVNIQVLSPHVTWQYEDDEHAYLVIVYNSKDHFYVCYVAGKDAFQNMI